MISKHKTEYIEWVDGHTLFNLETLYELNEDKSPDNYRGFLKIMEDN